MPFTPLVSAQAFVRDWLAAQFTPIRVVTERPANLADVLPVIQVTRFGGSDEFITIDSANIEIVAYASSANSVGGPSAQTAAETLAEQVRTAVRLHLPGYAANGAAVQSVTTISAPRDVPYDNPALRRFVASYRITIHSIPS